MSPTRLLLIGKQGAGFGRKKSQVCDDLTLAEYGANKCRINCPQNRFLLLYILGKTLKKSEVLAAACTILITQIALVTAMLGLGRLLSLRE
jgi:hypothetical protein